MDQKKNSRQKKILNKKRIMDQGKVANNIPPRARLEQEGV